MTKYYAEELARLACAALVVACVVAWAAILLGA
jgi:hypothetical protein